MWDKLFERQAAMLPDRVAPEFIEGLDMLRMSKPGIPDFEELSDRLMKATGWQVVAVPGLVPDEVFFDHLANRRFPSGALYRWEFAQGSRQLDVQVSGPLVLDDDLLTVQAAMAGVGLAYVYEDMVQAALASGALQQVLADWCPPTEGFYLYYPSRHHVPTALRILIELLQAEQAIPETRIPSSSI